VFDLREQTIDIAELRDVSLDPGDVFPDFFQRRGEFAVTATGDENVRILAYERFAVASPMPLLPPVTSAIFPSSLPIRSSCRVSRRDRTLESNAGYIDAFRWTTAYGRRLGRRSRLMPATDQGGPATAAQAQL